MGPAGEQPSLAEVMAVAGRQHDVIGHAQLRGLGLSNDAIRHRVRRGRLHRRYRGVYVVGRPRLSREGEWMAAVMAAGDGALLSHASAGELWGICPQLDAIEISIPLPRTVRRPGIRVHRRRPLARLDITEHLAIPVTSPARTLIDLAMRVPPAELERAVSEADKVELITVEQLREALESVPPGPGLGRLRATLDRRTFRLTDSELERRFIPITRRAGLPMPLTRQRLNGYRVDFYWPALDLVVETDGLRYHRTAAQQSRDARRDQAHTAAGLTTLRFSHEQVRFAPAEVESVLRRTARAAVDRSAGP